MSDGKSFQVVRSECNQCLFGPHKIVSTKRKIQILKDCIRKGQYFICHKPAVLKPEGKWKGSTDVCCAGFYNRMGHVSQTVRIARGLGVVEFVDLPDESEGGK